MLLVLPGGLSGHPGRADVVDIQEEILVVPSIDDNQPCRLAVCDPGYKGRRQGAQTSC